MALPRGGPSQAQSSTVNADAVQANKQAIANSKAVSAASPSQSASGADALAAARAAGSKVGADNSVRSVSPTGQQSTMTQGDKLSNDSKVVMDAKQHQGQMAAAVARAQERVQNNPAPSQSKNQGQGMSVG